MSTSLISVLGKSASASLAIWLCCGCQAPRPLAPDWFVEMAAAHRDAAIDSELPFSGFDEPTGDRAPRQGDAALYALILDGPDTSERWLMTLAVEDDAAVREDGKVAIRITVSDLEGDREVGATEQVRVKNLTTGLFPAAVKLHEIVEDAEPEAKVDDPEAESGDPAAGADGEERGGESGRSVKSTMSLVGALRRNDQLASMIWQAVQKPSLLSVLLNLGVTADVELLPSELYPSSPPLPDWGLTSYRVPLKLDLNGVPSLLCSIVTIDPVAPLSVGGGIVSLIAQRPDASTRLTMHLLAARRRAAERD